MALMASTTYLQRAKFPLCCGATILYGFGWTHPPKNAYLQGSDEPTKEQIKSFLMAMPVLGEKDMNNIHEWHEMKRNSFHMAILSNGQKQHLHDLFLECGFELVSSNGNNHCAGRENHLYVRKVKH